MKFAISNVFHVMRVRPRASLGAGCALLVTGFTLPMGAAPRTVTSPPSGLPFLALPGSANAATSVVISEFRISGPAGEEDSFVELFNSTGAAVSLAGWTLSWAGPDGRPVSVTVPEKTVLPVSGHYLFTGRTYSLKAVSPGDMPLPSAIAGGLRLSDADGKVVDAAGPRRGDAGFREGVGLADNAFEAFREQYAFVRKTIDGTPRDTDFNERDFDLVSATGKTGGLPVHLGAPGPQGLASAAVRQAPSTYISARGISSPMPLRPVQRPATRDATAAKAHRPARVIVTGRTLLRDREARGDGQKLGTLTVRLSFTNRTGAFLKPLDFTVQSITCGPAREGIADLHLLRSSVPSAAGGDTVGRSVWHASLVEPPVQLAGGGLNATARLGLPAGGIGPGASGEAIFVFGVEHAGRFRVALGSELLNLVLEGDTETPWRDVPDSSRQAGTDVDGPLLAVAGGPRERPAGWSGLRSDNGPPAGGGANAGGNSPVATASIVVEGNTNGGFDDPASPVRLSAMNADDAPGVIRLTFAGALNARDAENAGHYKMQVNDAAVGIEKVTCDGARGIVSLYVARGVLRAGDRVSVQWSGLLDAKGLISEGQAGPVTVK